MRKLVFVSVMVLCFLSCKENKKNEIALLDAKDFATQIEGKEVGLYTLKAGDLYMQVTNFGGRVVALWVPDKNGKLDDIALGRSSIQQYIDREGERFLGCIVGRYANRIGDGKFQIGDDIYTVPPWNNGQCLHGGLEGLDLVVWTVDAVSENEIVMSYISPDGAENDSAKFTGFPGELKIKMTYTLTKDNEFKIAYSAVTDKPTVVNLSHHGFFNLKGEGKGTINDHILVINADSITPVNKALIPTGERMPVAGTPFDFREATPIGERVDNDHEQLEYGRGYDHNWVLNRKSKKDVEFAASVYEPVSGRYMEVWTDQPGIQFYGGNFFDGKGQGKSGVPFNYREALALETQHFPDSPNRWDFPTTLLNPGDEYTQICIYKFSIKN